MAATSTRRAPGVVKSGLGPRDQPKTGKVGPSRLARRPVGGFDIFPLLANHHD